jgi:streptogramin lyase
MFGISRRLSRLMIVLQVAAVMALAPSLAHADPLLTEFNQPAGYGAFEPIAGPDGDVWFLNGTAGVGSITPSGTFAKIDFGTPMTNSFVSIAAGANNSIWVGDYGLHAIWRVLPDAPAGQQTKEFTTGLPAGASPQLLTLGTDGNIWFVDAVNHQIGRITPEGTITMFPGTLNSFAELNAMTVGPEGNLWFTDQDEGDEPAVGYVTVLGHITEIQVKGMPDDITAGPDGNVWFTDSEGIDKVNPMTGIVTEYSTNLQPDAVPDAIIAGPDGNVWFDDQYSNDYEVGRVTPNGTITEYELGEGLPVDLTLGLDGNIWVAQGAGMNPTAAPEAVDRIIPAEVITPEDIHRFSMGLHPEGIQDGDYIITGPDGNLWFTDSFAPKGIGKVLLQIPPMATTGGASVITSSTATIAGTVDPLGSATTVTVQYGTSAALGSTSTAAVTLPASGTASSVSLALTGLPAGTTIYYRVIATSIGGSATGATDTFTTSPLAGFGPGPQITPKPRTVIASLGDQQLTLITPSASVCETTNTSYAVSLSTKTLKAGTKLKFVSASFYLDKGVKHSRRGRRKVKVHRKTITKTVTIVTYSANAVAKRLPADEKLSLKGLAIGTHTLTVKVAYHETKTETVREHGKTVKVKKIVTVNKTLTAKLNIC